ncbi:MAG: LD-carboxypeptidase [bacterium]|nr:LD-carboxypeptidase [bacterium]
MTSKLIKRRRRVVKPKPLLPGKRIAVVSPAGPADESRFEAGLRELARWGYPVKAGAHTRGRYAYFSGRDVERLDDLIQAFSDPMVRAIFCSRGGYGSGRLLRKIPFDIIADNPKIFVGFSDLTAVNWAIWAATGLITFTGPTVCEIGTGLPETTRRSFLSMIGPSAVPDPIWAGPIKTVRPGDASGPLLPGCLSMIVTLLGTPFMPKLDGAVLLIEDIDEKPYRIDRMLTHLKNAGVLQQISALLVGQFVGCWPKIKTSEHLPLEEILLDVTSPHPIPVYTGFPFGHFPDRLTLPVGARVSVSEREGLRLLEDPLGR